MKLVFELDRNRLVDAATGAQVTSLQLAYPDKYPLFISVSKGNQPFVFSGNVYVTLKPAASPLSAPLALLTVQVNSSSSVSGVLDTFVQEMDDFLPAANRRAVAFEVLVVSTSDSTEVSVSVNAQISRRYNSVDQPGVTVAEKSLATQAEAQAGVNNTKWMSPLRVSQAISALANPLDDTDDLSEGTTNLYFTEARAKDALATDLSEIGSDITELTGKTGQLETDLSTEAQTRAAAVTDLATALDSKQTIRTTESLQLQEGDNQLPVSRNTLYLLSGSFTLARIFLPTYLPEGTGPWIGDRIRIVWVGVKANANSRIVVNAFAGQSSFPALAHLHNEGQAADFVLDSRPNSFGQITWRSDVSPIRWVQPPATPTALVAPNGGVYSPSDVAFDGSYFYIYGKKPDGSPVWLRSPMASTW